MFRLRNGVFTTLAVLLAGCVGDPPSLDSAPTPTPEPSVAAATAAPAPPVQPSDFHRRVTAWHSTYVAALARLADPYAAVQASSAPRDRAVCNALLTGGFEAKAITGSSEDLDIDRSVDHFFEAITSVGHACLRDEDASVVLHGVAAFGSAELVDRLVRERYGSDASLAKLFEPPKVDAMEVLASAERASRGGQAAPPATAPLQAVTATQATARVTESNSSWSRFAWKVLLTNTGTTAVRVRLDVEFVDGGGFTVESDTEYGVQLAGGEARIVYGDRLINAGSRERVAAVRPVIR